jgi:hypothetical protein
MNEIVAEGRDWTLMMGSLIGEGFLVLFVSVNGKYQAILLEPEMIKAIGAFGEEFSKNLNSLTSSLDSFSKFEWKEE